VGRSHPGDFGSATLVLLLLLSGLLGLATGSAGEAAAVPCQRLLIPAYFYSSASSQPTWNQAIAGAPTVKFIIADPANGPGTSVDPNYTAVIRQAQVAGVTVLAYVDTNYAKRPGAQVRVDIDRWRSFYGVTSIFIDRASSGASKLCYYRRLAKKINELPRTTIILNPGTIPAEQYLTIGDVIVNFEGSATKYATADFPTWVQDFDAKRFAHLIYAVNDAESMTEVLAEAKERNAGYVYATDDVLSPNPWDTLPPYFSEELMAAANNCDP
jgi:hypothetical protein